MPTKPLYIALFIALSLTFASVGVIHAEYSTYGDLFVATWLDVDDQYYAQTTDTNGTSVYMRAHIRVWGPGENPLKDEDFDYTNTSQSIRTPNGVADGYLGFYVSEHKRQNYYGGPYEYRYTSGTGTTSNACYFNGGSNC